ncbi:TlpA disulfide reductase family protein [Parabacteroides sp. PF5-9]|uniref:TlpA family protein disulfide reductase n=1 Tax=Parabacteroides sp. PF5-9 TaxID=1742404 RepID=UPI002474B1BD|nr:TlpA disulfide reductase family protein [Parabacteroides sp. PF5-9]MDH6358044.1 peroxiredoxin [Parabacteroides sp. PF5-9]
MRYTWFITLLTFSLFSCINEDDPNSGEMINYIHTGDKVPSFTVSDGAEGLFNSEEFLGKKSLLVLFSTTCEDCDRELPIVQRVWENLMDDPQYLVVAIARQQSKEVTDTYWNDEKRQFTIPKYIDPDRSIFNLFANSTIPRLYIINEEGIVTWMAIEKLHINADQLTALIQNTQ